VEIYVPPTCRAYSMRTASKAPAAPPGLGTYVACMGALTNNPPPREAESAAAAAAVGWGGDGVAEGLGAGAGGRSGGSAGPRTKSKYGLRAERLHDLSGAGEVPDPEP
jgi:hypothetical protein